MSRRCAKQDVAAFLMKFRSRLPDHVTAFADIYRRSRWSDRQWG